MPRAAAKWALVAILVPFYWCVSWIKRASFSIRLLRSAGCRRWCRLMSRRADRPARAEYLKMKGSCQRPGKHEILLCAEFMYTFCRSRRNQDELWSQQWAAKGHFIRKYEELLVTVKPFNRIFHSGFYPAWTRVLRISSSGNARSVIPNTKWMPRDEEISHC